MEIKINKLHLHNFKGTREAVYAFDGENARIEGPNGSGKSTVFDAFTWLLFGKDHRGQSTEAFELKTIDPATGAPTPREEHWVEAELVVDGRVTTLRRCWTENWVKPTGETEEVMRGHTTTFLVDGVDVGTKKAYDAVVTGWMNEDMFKLLTNPHYFIDDAFTPWKNRRKALMELVNGDPGLEKVRESFADVIDALSGRSIEEYRKRLTLERNANKKDLELCQNKIAGIKSALPEEVNEAEIRKQIATYQAEHDQKVQAIKGEIERINKALTGGDGADEKRQAQNRAIWAEITQVQLWMSNYINQERNDALEQNKAHERALFEAKAYSETADSLHGSLKMTLERLRAELADKTTARGQGAADLAALGEKYNKEKALAFSYTPTTRCAYCGQEIPAASQEEARAKAEAHFIEERKATLDHIIKEAGLIRERVTSLDKEIAGLKDQIEKTEADYTKALADSNKWKEQVLKLEQEPLVDLAELERGIRMRPEFRAKAKEEQDLRIKASNTAYNPDDKEELMQEKAQQETLLSAADAELTLKVKPLEAQLAVNAERTRQLSLVKQLEQEAKSFADAIAKDERLEARAAEYMKAQVDSVEGALNILFAHARWKMFDRTLDGGLVEMCEVMSPDGVPYRSMNDAMKILCGMDVIRAFSEAYGRMAPIFVDNAEGVLLTHFGTQAQVIRLVVKDVEKLTLVKE